jgi:hypothetical protein
MTTPQLIPQVPRPPSWKTPLKGSRFDSREDIIQNATARLQTIPKRAFKNCFQRWKDRWANCVESQGAYIEGIVTTQIQNFLSRLKVDTFWTE